jgi:hypothetical protein
MGEGFSAVPASIDGSAHLLLEIAGVLEQGRLDGDIGTMARVPRSHKDVSAAVLDFAADVPPEEMTQAQYRELAARYNGGPHWEGGDAQGYADRFEQNREQAEQALR